MFNERDRRCAAVQLMLSTDPSYDNRTIASRTIASTFKMQIRTVQRAQGDGNKVSSYGYGLRYSFKWGPHHATLHLRSRLESQHQSVPGCVEECGDPLVQSGGRWQTLCVAAGLGAGPQVQRDPGLASEGVLRLCNYPPPPTTSTRWTTPWEGVHWCMSLVSSSLLFQLCPACLVRLFWIGFVMGGRWPFFVGCCLQDLFNIARNILV